MLEIDTVNFTRQGVLATRITCLGDFPDKIHRLNQLQRNKSTRATDII